MSFDVLFQFEEALSRYTGAPYAVVTDGCTHAIELCMRYDAVTQTQFTAYTYISVPMLMRHLNIDFSMTDESWTGEYQFAHTRIWDSARRLEPGMYRPGQMQCLSFGNTKPLHIGKCGAVLLDDVAAYRKLSKMRSDGRDLSVSPWISQEKFTKGYHYCPTLEDCKKGLDALKTIEPQCQTVSYPDLRSVAITDH